MTRNGTSRSGSGQGIRFPFSLEQEFLRGQHENDGSTAGFGQRPISSIGWRLRGPLDVETLRQALDDVVVRHEPLRTAVVKGDDGWQQEVNPPSPVRMVIEELPDDGRPRDVVAEEFLNAAEAQPYDGAELPQLRAFLGRFDTRDAVLVLVSYLPLVDFWSLGVVVRDLGDCYAARLSGQLPPPPSAPNYRAYVAEQGAMKPPEESFAYWRKKLQGARAFELSADHPPAENPSGTTRVDRFSVEPELGRTALALARSSGCSPFMLLLAVHLEQLRRMTGRSDGVVWTLTSGPSRRKEQLQDAVGYFVNMSPLRVDFSDCETFRQLVERVRSACLEAYQHEVPFVQLAQELGDVIGTLEQGGMVVPGFALFQNLSQVDSRTIGGITFSSIQRRLSQDAGPGIPDDAILWTIELDSDGVLCYAMSSSTDRYESATTKAMVSDFQRILTCVTDPDRPLAEF